MRFTIKSIILLLITVLVILSFKSTKSGLENTNKDDPDYNKFKGNKMLIITTPVYSGELTEFVKFKKSKGFDVELDTKSASNGDSSVKSAILKKYKKTGLDYVILVGDIDDVPSPYFQGAPSDPSYVLLEGDDLIGDALISRISANSNSELKNIMNKIVLYQKGEFKETGWISKGIVIGTAEFDGVNHTSGIAKVMENQQAFKNVKLVLETDTDPHASLLNYIKNEGANMIVMNSHGSPHGFHSPKFVSDDLTFLSTFGGSFPFIHGAGCSTGDFDTPGQNCFAEAVIKTGSVEHPAGVTAILAFSRSASPPPAMMAQRIAFKELYYKDEIKTIGELCYFSNLKSLKSFNQYIAEPFYKHFHLFGDCSAPIWKNPPLQ